MKEKKIKGLTTKQVEDRIAKGLVNRDVTVPTKSFKQIIIDNTLTPFNFLNFGIVAVIILAGVVCGRLFDSLKNCLFIGTVFLNMFISIFNEIRSKKIVDKLSLLDEAKVIVLRDGYEIETDKENVVLDDVVLLRTGSQVMLDSTVLEGECLVNESLITGEDDPILKKVGDEVLSGSFIISGKVTTKVIHIGEDNYTSKISKDAKYVKELNSELMHSLNKVIKSISYVIIPIGILLFITQLNIKGTTFDAAVLGSTGALIGMIPDGLILLTSSVLAVSVYRLAKQNVLVQELYCIETLARVDVLCLDKTGTITEGVMEVKGEDLESSTTPSEFYKLLDSYCHSVDDISPTMDAIKEKYMTKNGKAFNYKKVNPFSSEKKYSSIELNDCEYYLGAYDFILKKKNKQYDDYSNDYRVILFAKKVGKEMIPLGVILIQDKIRESAKNTIKYFKEQGVEIKVISGDNPSTVSNIAKRVDIDGWDKFIDLSTLSTHEELKEAFKKYTIFGRVKPNQKKELMIIAKELGHTVAMTGDGVNDVLALKEADCSIAMASGTEATRNVSQLVLMDSNFDSLPHVVYEGRRTINNITRSASLFLVKTIYTMLITATLIFLGFNYPFRPIHLSLMNLITIGAPSFILAMEPNNERIKGTFLTMVIEKAFPISLTVYSMVIVLMFISGSMAFNSTQVSTICVLLTTIIMLIYQFKLCIPFNTIRRLMFISLSSLFVIEILFFRDFFMLAELTQELIFVTILLLILGILLWRLFNSMLKFFKKYSRKYLRKV